MKQVLLPNLLSLQFIILRYQKWPLVKEQCWGDPSPQPVYGAPRPLAAIEGAQAGGSSKAGLVKGISHGIVCSLYSVRCGGVVRVHACQERLSLEPA